MEGKRLTFWEASSLIMGAGVGAGILAVPYLASLSGFSVFVVVLAVAYAASCLLHLMLAEVMFRTDRELQIVELMRRYVFRGIRDRGGSPGPREPGRLLPRKGV